jgi:hypothetical protein
MATPRNSAGINKNGGKSVNPVYKAVSTLTSYAGNLGRELRDIPTAAGTLAKTIQNVKPSQGGGTPTAKSQRAVNQAGSNVGKQIKEVGSAIISGKSGTTSAQSKIKREVIPGKKRK